MIHPNWQPRWGVLYRVACQGEKMDEAVSDTFGNLLRRHRLAAGLTQEELAERVGLGRRSIQGMERGENIPHRGTLQRLVQALELSATEQSRFEELAQSALRLPRPAVALLHAISPTVELARCHNLPVDLTRFVGREPELAEVQRQLASTRLLTLAGPGGVGKTRLALKLAEEVVDQYRDGVWLVELASLADGALVPKAVATALGVLEQVGRPLDLSLVDALRDAQLLLVVDNCEHLVQAAASLVLTLLRGCPDVQIIATSRQTLRVPGEITWRVPPMALPRFDDTPHRRYARSL